jgi:hypothetical protein
MEIFQDIFKILPVRGNVKVEVFHPEDPMRKEPTFYEEGENGVGSYALNELAAALRSASTGSTAYDLNPWPNVDTYDKCYPSYTSGTFPSATHDTGFASSALEDQDGIFIETAVTGVTGYSFPGEGIGDFTQALALGYNKSESVASNAVTWAGEAKWMGKHDGSGDVDGSTASGSITLFKLGKDFRCQSQTNSDFGHPSGVDNKLYANYTASAFSLDVDDIVKATWTITIG